MAFNKEIWVRNLLYVEKSQLFWSAEIRFEVNQRSVNGIQGTDTGIYNYYWLHFSDINDI